jgi:hypothetical protein
MTSTHRHNLMALENASEKLISFFPNLREAYSKEVDSWQSETPGPYIVYEDVFNPYLKKLLASNDTKGLQRTFDFIELLVTADDFRLHDLVRIAILTPLTVDPSQLAEARHYMGPVTKGVLGQVQNS